MSRPNLPDFAHPPVNEVALSIQFQPLSALRIIHLGSLWERFGREHFASVEEQPPIPKMIERFGMVRQAIAPQFEILNMAPLPRVLFVSSTGNEIVQVQKDRFTYNWRKRSETDVYPRYESIEEQFIRFLDIFQSFLSDQRLGALRVEQAEVTYVNQIPQAEIRNRVEKVISVLSGRYTDSYLHDPEEVRLSLKFPMIKEERPIGRLHIDVFGGSQADSPVINLMLLARGISIGNDINSAIEFFHAGRAAIVNGFASITSKEMHQAWGRIDDLSNQI
jgi:uncharacterized protein (TIGR04255 family)